MLDVGHGDCFLLRLPGGQTVGIDAAILSKIDADAKGGAALSITHSIGKPILFVGTGQEYDDIAFFDAKWMVERLFEGK